MSHPMPLPLNSDKLVFLDSVWDDCLAFKYISGSSTGFPKVGLNRLFFLVISN